MRGPPRPATVAVNSSVRVRTHRAAETSYRHSHDSSGESPTGKEAEAASPISGAAVLPSLPCATDSSSSAATGAEEEG